VELVLVIEEFFIEQVRERVAEELEIASRCFKNECSVLDHADRSTLLEAYAECATIPFLRCSMDFPEKPNDEQLVQVLEESNRYYSMTPVLEYHEEEEAHQTNRSNWPELIGGIFSTSNRRAFQTRFGLDIRSSFVSLPDNGIFSDEFGFPQATIAYLTLPGSVKRRRKWHGNVREMSDNNILHEYPSMEKTVSAWL
jgi:hypothetical protein